MTDGLPARRGAGIGGTVTDIVLECGGTPQSARMLTTHATPEQAIPDGRVQAMAAAGTGFSAPGLVLRGTPLAINSLTEPRGDRFAVAGRIGADGLEM